jgi:hypothetical protein
LGQNVKNGTFLCRYSKIKDFGIGKDAIEEIDAFLRDYKFLISLAQTYDIGDVLRNALKEMRGYKLPLRKRLWEEDVTVDYLDDNICRDKIIK